MEKFLRKFVSTRVRRRVVWLFSANLAFFLVLSLDARANVLDADTLIGSVNHRPALVLFYAAKCPSCDEALRQIPLYQKSLHGWTLLVGTLTQPTLALREQLKRQNVQLIDLSSVDGNAVVRSLGDTQATLPFNIALNPIPVPSNEVCARWIGLLTPETIAFWKQSCAR